MDQLKQVIANLSVQEFNNVVDSIPDITLLEDDILSWMLTSLETSSLSGLSLDQLSYHHFKEIVDLVIRMIGVMNMDLVRDHANMVVARSRECVRRTPLYYE